MKPVFQQPVNGVDSLQITDWIENIRILSRVASFGGAYINVKLEIDDGAAFSIHYHL